MSIHPDPIFVFCAPRPSTTFLGELLCSHPEGSVQSAFREGNAA